MCLKRSTKVLKIARAILNISYSVSLLTSAWRTAPEIPRPQGRKPLISHFIAFLFQIDFFVLTAQFLDNRKLLFENQEYK